jgi:hypothetical protein
VVAGAVDDDAQLSEELLAATPESAEEVRAQVLRLVGDTNEFEDDAEVRFRDQVRNPWIAEVLAHALLVLRRRDVTACLRGAIVALKQPHPDPRRQGLDLVAIYEYEGLPWAAIGEAKASRRYGSARLNEAAAFFADIDHGLRGVELRGEFHALKHVLNSGLRASIGDGFWRGRCCYLPIIVFCDAIDECSDHTALATLRPDVSERRLIAVCLPNFHVFFDQIADEIRGALQDLLP